MSSFIVDDFRSNNKSFNSKSTGIKASNLKARNTKQTMLWLKTKLFESGCLVFDEDHTKNHHAIDRCFQSSLPSFNKFRNSIVQRNSSSALSNLSMDNIIKNICALRTAYVGRIARPLVQHLMSDKRNCNLFNLPVDPIKLQIPQYFDIIKKPMDLGTVRSNLRSGQYLNLKNCFIDIEQVFTNAMKFNSRDHVIYKIAKELLEEFHHEVNIILEKCLKENEKKQNHNCSLCSGSTCHLCGDKCLKFDPLKLCCQKCPQHIKKNDIFYITPDGSSVWCQKCYLSLPIVILPPITISEQAIDRISCNDINSLVDVQAESTALTITKINDEPALLKKNLLKRCADEEVAEPWVACDSCGHWYHQICSLYNNIQENPSSSSSTTLEEEEEEEKTFCCPFCILLLCCRDQNINLNYSLNDILNSDVVADGMVSHKHVVPIVGTNSSQVIVETVTISSTHKNKKSLKRYQSMNSISSNASHVSSETTFSDNDEDNTLIVAGEEHGQLQLYMDDNYNSPMHENGISDTSSLALDYDAFSPSSTIKTPFNKKIELTKDVFQKKTVIDLVSSYSSDNEDFSLQNGNTVTEKNTWKKFAARTHSIYRAASLPCTLLSNFLEYLVRDLLFCNGFADMIDTVTIRVTSNRDHALDIPKSIHENLCTPTGHQLPESLGYQQKCILLFQEIDGVDVCLFSLYVHEFNNQCPEPNTSTVYIAYLDSVQYFRPIEARTIVQQEIVGGYLKWAQTRGFKQAHIWACPPHRGDNFIFNCHPNHQRNPSRDHLNAWYRSIIDRCTATGVISHSNNFWQDYFSKYLRREVVTEVRKAAKVSYVKSGKLLKLKTGKLSLKDLNINNQIEFDQLVKNDTTDATNMSNMSDNYEVPHCPPIFESDYWVQQYTMLINSRTYKSKLTLNSNVKDKLNYLRKVNNLLKKLMNREEALPFLEPVDPIKLEIPTYPEVIKAPMDLGTVRDKLITMQYTSLLDFVQDVRLTFQNAMVFNPPDNSIHTLADFLLKKFEQGLEMFIKDVINYKDAFEFCSFIDNNVTLSNEILSQVLLIKNTNNQNSSTNLSDLECISPTSNNRSNSNNEFIDDADENDFNNSIKRRLQRVVSEDYTVTNDDTTTVFENNCNSSKRRKSSVVDSISSGCNQYYGDMDDVRNTSDYFPPRTNNCSMMESLEEDFSANALNNSHVPKLFGEPVLGYKNAMTLVAELSKLMQRGTDDLFVLKFAPIPSYNDYHHSELQSSSLSSIKSNVNSIVKRKPRGRTSFQSKILSRSSTNFAGGLKSINYDCFLILKSIEPDTSDPDHNIESPLTDSRYTFLEMCQFKHLQFDTLRRAKHSSLILLYYLQNPKNKACHPNCYKCNSSIQNIRWHCDQCASFDLCETCYHTTTIIQSCDKLINTTMVNNIDNESIQDFHPHPLTPYRVTYK